VHPAAKAASLGLIWAAVTLIGAVIGGLVAGLICLVVAGILAVAFGVERIRTALHLPGTPMKEVPASHRNELTQLANAYSTTVGYWRPAQGKQNELLERSFWAHFSDAGKLLEEHDVALEQYEEAKTALHEWLTAKDQQRGWLVESAIENGVGLAWSVNSGHLWLSGGHGIAPVDESTDVDALKRPYEELLADGAVTHEASVVKARLAKLRAKQGETLSELERIGSLHVIRGRCERC
jgi:hypothetical protein